MTIFQISPYAAKAIVRHVWTGFSLLIYVTFRFPMDTTIRPPTAKWIVKVDSVAKAVIPNVWLDEFTIRLTTFSVTSLPGDVTLEYDGPDSNLRTTWDKQWEPWGPITSINIPIDDNNFGMVTIEGGFAVKLTNRTGAVSIAGEVVKPDPANSNSVILTAANDLFPIGVFWKSGDANGAFSWIVTSGIGAVRMDAGGCAIDDRIITSVTPGRGLVNNLPAVAQHFQEIAHSVQAAAANATAECILHFN